MEVELTELFYDMPPTKNGVNVFIYVLYTKSHIFSNALYLKTPKILMMLSIL